MQCHSVRLGASLRPALALQPRRTVQRVAKVQRGMTVRPMAAAGDDPYQVLGVPADADSNAIQRAYRKKVGEFKGKDEAKVQAIEAAHSAIMMRQLTSRLSGGVSVEKDVLYADRPRYFPWRPKLWMAATDILLYSAIAQGLFLAWALLTPLTAGTQPVIASALAGAVGNIIKQNRLYPVPKGGPDSPPDEKKQGSKNVLRGFFLAFLATFAGCLLSYTIPDAVAAAMGRVMPVWFYEGQTMLLAIGTCTFNYLFTGFTK